MVRRDGSRDHLGCTGRERLDETKTTPCGTALPVTAPREYLTRRIAIPTPAAIRVHLPRDVAGARPILEAIALNESPTSGPPESSSRSSNEWCSSERTHVRGRISTRRADHLRQRSSSACPSRGRCVSQAPRPGVYPTSAPSPPRRTSRLHHQIDDIIGVRRSGR